LALEHAMTDKKVVVAGATGLVGNAALRHFGGAGGCDVVALARRKPRELYGARFVPIDLTDPAQCLRAAADLPSQIDAAKPHIEKEMPPFAPLLLRVKQDYERFGFARPHAPKDRDEGRRCLKQQLKMIDWYERKEQVVQALSLAREWIVSLMCYEFQIDPLNDANRTRVEGLLNGGKKRETSSLRSHWEAIDFHKREQLLNLWGGTGNRLSNKQTSPELTSLRNDVLHAGLDHRAKSTRKVLSETKAVVEELRDIALLWLYDKKVKHKEGL